MSIRRDDIYKLTRELWNEQGTLDLDQVDGTFYFQICRADEVRAIVDDDVKAFRQRDPDRWVRFHPLYQLMPNFGRQNFDKARPSIRDAVDLCGIQYGWRLTAEGNLLLAEDISAPGTVGQAWVKLGVRNQNWTGSRVEEAFRNFQVGNSSVPAPPYPEDEMLTFVGAKYYAQGQYETVTHWNESGEPQLFSLPWEPMIVISVPEPLPPKGVIASFYDTAIRGEKKWHERLLGASNGQSVATAIRTWAIALLMKTGMTFGQASGALHYTEGVIDGKEVSQQKYGEDKRALLVRAPEAAEFI